MEKKPLKLTISFSKKYEDIFYYLSSQENTSKFICELVRKEMRNSKKGESLEEKVYEILLRYLEDENLTLNSGTMQSKTSQSNSDLLDEEVDLLKDLFG
jgi:hypothetical protein